MKFVLYLLMEIKRNFIAPIHPKLEIRRNRVACINELPCIIEKTTLVETYFLIYLYENKYRLKIECLTKK